MRLPVLFSLLIFLFLVVLLPIAFGQLMLAGLAKLQLSPGAALFAVIGIFFGGLVNIPVRRIVRDEAITVHPLEIYGLGNFWPRLAHRRRETVIAVNLGGCVIPTVLAFYELLRIAALDPTALGSVAIASGANIIACYWMAKPVPGTGIVMPGLLSPLVAATLALLLTPDAAAPVAFVAGIAGPLIGADLLHLRDLRTGAFGMASIGGAGTFDGIVLSGILAAYLA